MNYGRYQIVKEVGKGSMGVVYQARDPHIERLVAVKVLRPDRVTSDDFVKRFLKEARVIGRLSHSNIVAIYDVGEEQGSVYIAMEFLEGVSLSDIIKEKRPDLREIVALGVQLAETLDYAHQKKVVHRDIKPSNIIVQSDGQVKITDFGIAHVEDANATLQTQAGDIMGTPSYMSPEQVLSKPVDGRTDIFSLGVILYEMTAGRRPFGGDGKALMTVMNEVVELTPPEPVGIPGELSRAIMKALQKDPANRFQTGKEFADNLRNCLDEAAKQAPRKGAEPKPSPASPSKRTRIYAVVVGVTLVLATGGYVMMSGSPKSAQSLPVIKPAAQAPLSDTAPIGIGTTAVTAPSLPPVPVTSPPVPVPSPKPPAGSSSAAHPVVVSAPLDTSRSPKSVDNVAVEKPIKKKAPVPEPATVSGTLNVVTSPPGAKVYINGVYKGTSPTVLILNSGAYRVKLSRAGYLDLDRKIKLKGNSEYPLSEELKPAE